MSFFIKNTRVAALIAIGMLIWGVSAVITIPKESAPQIDYGIIIINTFYDGASAVDIDALVTQEIENKVKEISEIDTITSTSRNSFSTIQLQLDPSADVGKILNDVRSKVDEAKPKLPSDAEDPTITEINSSNERSLFTVHMTGDIHPALLRDYAENLKNYLEQFSYVNNVNISGGAEREIFVDIHPLELEQYGLSSTDVTNAIRSVHRDSPIGNFDIDNLEYSLRFQGRLKEAEDIRNIVLATRGANTSEAAVVKIEDIADVYETNEKLTSIQSFITPEMEERVSSVKLDVKKTKSKDIFKVDPQAKQAIKDYVDRNFGSEVNIYYSGEELDEVRDSYDNVIRSGVTSIVIVILILMFFIGIRESFAAGMVIPLTFLTTIAVTNFMGETLNFMVNFSMILALGILVDTAIVIVEGIHEGIHKGFSPKDAAMMAVEEFKAPLISGMLTTLAVFIPLLSLPDILGKYLSYIPISVAITLTASLGISLFLVPAIASNILKSKEEKAASRDCPSRITFLIRTYQNWYNKKYEQATAAYKKYIEKNIHSRLWRIGSIYAVFIAFLLSLLIPVQFSLFPSDDFDMMWVEVNLPEGTVQEETLQKTLPVEDIIMALPETKQLEISVSDNSAFLTTTFLKKDTREALGMRTSIQISDDLRKEFKKFTTYDVDIKELSMGPPVDAAVAFKVIVNDADQLSLAQKVAEDFKQMLKDIPGTDNIKDDISNVPGEVTYRINREEALRLGVPPDQIATAVRIAVKGMEAATITRSGREVAVTVRYKENSIKDFNDINNIQIPNTRGDFISLSQIVTQELTPALSEIKRSDRRIAVKVTSALTPEGNALEVTQAFNKMLQTYDLPEGVIVEDAGENADNSELFIALGFGFIMAIFMIFAILVVQFNSFAQPFIILFTIIMSLLGVNIGLYLTDTPRSLAFIIGVISLAGIVVNDAIILVDRINNLRKKYQDKFLGDVIAFAGMTRLQPITLTTMTTAAGVFPLIFVDSFWAGLAITIIFGLSVASTLTLFVTPMMYYQFESEIVLTLLPAPMIIGAFISLNSLFSLNWIGFIIGAFISWGAFFFFKRKLQKVESETPKVTIIE